MDGQAFDTHLFLFPLKSAQGRTASVDFEQQALKLDIVTEQTQSLFQELSETRSALLAHLDTTDSTPESVDVALKSYLFSLNHLLIPSSNVDADVDAGRPWASSNSLFEFEWRSALGNDSVVAASSDVRYETICILLSVALWKALKGAELCTKAGWTRPTATEISQAYELYQQAASAVSQALEVIPHLENYSSLDCNRAVLEGLFNAFLAEAEGLNVLKAVAEGAPMSMLAGLTMNLHGLYQSASSMQTADIACLNKFIVYLQYKSECFKAYSLVFQARASVAGIEAVTLAQEGHKVFEGACALGNAYDSLNPETAFNVRSGFLYNLEKMITEAMATADKDNQGDSAMHETGGGVQNDKCVQKVLEVPEVMYMRHPIRECKASPQHTTINVDSLSKFAQKKLTETTPVPGDNATVAASAEQLSTPEEDKNWCIRALCLFPLYLLAKGVEKIGGVCEFFMKPLIFICDVLQFIFEGIFPLLEILLQVIFCPFVVCAD